MLNHAGPGTAYTLLFDDDDGDGPGLPPEVRAIYGGDWRLPDAPPRRPYTFTNFVVAQDGRISFDEPQHTGGGDISRHIAHDTWLMGLLRSRADAILTGAGTLRASGDHCWTPWATFPAARATFTALRRAEGRSPLPIFVLLTASGNVPITAALTVPDQAVLIATTATGVVRARTLLAGLPHIRYHVSPGPTVDLAALLATLRANEGVQSLLSEGGAHVYGALIQAGLLDEVFTTLSPVIVGNRLPPAAPRPNLVEGVAFDPRHPPQVRLISLRRHGDYLFQRARLEFATKV